MNSYWVGYLARKHGLQLCDISGVPAAWIRMTVGEQVPEYYELRRGYAKRESDELIERIRKFLLEIANENSIADQCQQRVDRHSSGASVGNVWGGDRGADSEGTGEGA